MCLFLPFEMTESTTNELLFNWDSEIQNQRMNQYKAHTERQVQYLDRVFEEKTDNKTRDFNGKIIINNTKEKEWFKLNVALVFSIGCIFNERDRIKFDQILQLFNNNGDVAFLMNCHKIMNYNDKLIQTIEKTMEVENGNYQAYLIEIVQKNDEKILADAPEEK